MLFMLSARLVTGDSTVAGPGENRFFMQWLFFVLNSGSDNEEIPGSPSGLRLSGGGSTNC